MRTRGLTASAPSGPAIKGLQSSSMISRRLDHRAHAEHRVPYRGDVTPSSLPAGAVAERWNGKH
jgi:hypothetical protein